MTYPLCATCERPMRPRYSSIADHPGTVGAEGGTSCGSCRSRVRREASERVHIDLDEVRRMVGAGISDNGIARKLGVTAVTIRRRRHEAGIPAGVRIASYGLDYHRPASLTHDETDQALCAQTDPEVFFSPEGRGITAEKARRIEAAKRICAACPIAARCLEVALANGEAHGIWAGTTPDDRARMAKRQEEVA